MRSQLELTFDESIAGSPLVLDAAGELRLNQSLLILATGIVCVCMMIWSLLYTWTGTPISVDVPLLFMLLLLGNLLIYAWKKSFNYFRISQLGLLLFIPFASQWAMGNLIEAGGLIVWGLLAPIGALLCIGSRQSLGWFIAWGLLALLSGGADYYLADPLMHTRSELHLQSSILFLTLNLISVAIVSYVLLLFYITQRQRLLVQLELTRKELMSANQAAQNLLNDPVIFI